MRRKQHGVLGKSCRSRTPEGIMMWKPKEDKSSRRRNGQTYQMPQKSMEKTYIAPMRLGYFWNR